jgi:hypothetical protein
MKLLRLRIFFSFLLVLSQTAISYSQDEGGSLLDLLPEEEETVDYVSASFKSTLVVNLESIENTHAGVLDFKVMHRFGPVNEGWYEFYGLDQATTRLAFKYGITDRLELGIGRSTLNKNFDGSLKWRILWQSTGAKIMPLSLSFYTVASYKSIQYPENDPREVYRVDNFNYSFQFLLARKFNEKITFQLVPSMVHRNIVATSAEKNDVFSLGFGGRVKLTNRLSINLEYYYNFPDQLAEIYTDPLSIGLDIETGGHVFQLLLTNAKGMVTDAALTETTGKWSEGDIRFGFNISRVFTIVDPQKEKVKKEKKKDA